MILHLDTHSFLWFVWEDPRLPESVYDAIEDPANHICVSIVSLWGFIEKQFEQTHVRVTNRRFFAKNVDGNGFRVLPVTRAHLLTCIACRSTTATRSTDC